MDTGSSDLWVNDQGGAIQLSSPQTSLTVTDSFGAGVDGNSITGTVQFAELQFGGFTVPQQGGSSSALAVTFMAY